MSSFEGFRRFADQGWTTEVKLSLCLQYIANQQDDAAFEDFLREQAEQEAADVAASDDLRPNPPPRSPMDNNKLTNRELARQLVAPMINDVKALLAEGLEIDSDMLTETWTDSVAVALTTVRSTNTSPGDLLVGLKRAIAALNTRPNFTTNEGIKSYDLLPQLEAIVKRAEAP